MKTTIKSTSHTFDPEDVDRVAAELKAEDPDWDYVVRHDPKDTGYSLIDIFDEDGEFVATF